MNFYEKFGLSPLINASETYTNLGGSLMGARTLEAMRQAGEGFVDMHALTDAVCARAAALTRNEGAFITTGAAAGVILAACACLCGMNEALHDSIPDTSAFAHREILVYAGAYRDLIPYWRLIGLTGAIIVPVPPSIDAMRNAITPRTAGIFLFPGTLYEKDVPSCEETLAALADTGIPMVVDAAAQLPPATNLWRYTKELGAALAIFSGGKHLRGPQSTGLIVGRKDMIAACRLSACPHPRIGRAFKTGKEDLAGFITALELFLEEPEEDRYARQASLLEDLARRLSRNSEIQTEWVSEGRLGTHQPLLLVTLPEHRTAVACNRFTRACQPPIDIGIYPPECGMPENVIFLNAYNLKAHEVEAVAEAVLRYVDSASE